MGTPFEVNSILKLRPEQGLPKNPVVSADVLKAQKNGYRLIPLDVPIALVNDQWLEVGTVIVQKSTWGNQKTYLEYTVVEIKDTPKPLPSAKQLPIDEEGIDF